MLLVCLVLAARGDAANGVVMTLGAGLLLCGGALILRGILLERRLREMLDHERARLLGLTDREQQLARVNRQLLEDSRRDSLTGMRNRRALSDDLPGIEELHRERGATYTLALCDIDHFKAYNDRLGHLAGDQALRAVAATVQGALRSGDVAYRFGGEELLLIMPDTELGDAMTASERVREAVQRAAIPHPDGIGGVLTVSIGLAAGHEEAATLLARADAALYEAKHEGRNRVVATSATAGSPAIGRTRTVAEETMPRHLRSMLAVSRAAAAGQGVDPGSRGARRDDPLRALLPGGGRPPARSRGRRAALRHCARRRGGPAPAAGLRQPVARVGGRCSTPSTSARVRSGCRRDRTTGTARRFSGCLRRSPASVPMPGIRTTCCCCRCATRPGTILGVVSVDQPLSGRRPGDAELSCLMAVVRPRRAGPGPGPA